MTQNLGSEVHLARILLAKAESQLITAKEQARITRRRRKEAKQSARHAKKRARQAKEQMAEAKLALAKAEEKLAKANQRPVKRKTPSKPAKKVVAASGPKKTQTAAKRGKAKTKTAPRGAATRKAVTVPRTLETPDVNAAKATNAIVKGIEEIFDGAIQARTPGETGPTKPKPIITDQN